MTKETAIALLNNLRAFSEDDDEPAIDMAIEALRAEPKTGEWIILDECSNDGVYCSRCHKKVLKIEYSKTMKRKNFNFCPNCGARMIGVERI